MIDIVTLALCIFLIIYITTISIINGIGPTPSNARVRSALLEYLIKNFPSDKPHKFVDLGSGWGGLVSQLEQRYPLSQINGYENNLVPYLWSSMQTRLGKRKSTKIYFENFLDKDWKRDEILIAYLAPPIMEKIATQLKTKGRPKCLISLCFSLPNWPESHSFKATDFHQTPIYIYDFYT